MSRCIGQIGPLNSHDSCDSGLVANLPPKQLCGLPLRSRRCRIPLTLFARGGQKAVEIVATHILKF